MNARVMHTNPHLFNGVIKVDTKPETHGKMHQHVDKVKPAWITSPVSKRCLSSTKGVRPGAATSIVISSPLHVTLKPLLGGTTSI